jgi:flagellar biosynthesis protein FlhG
MRGTEARVVAVTSGKGGVGKTNLALNLAIALAGRAQRVVLWDADLGLANVQVLLRLHPEGTLSDVLAERKSVREIIMDTPIGIRVVPGASGDEHMANLSPREREVFTEAVRELVEDADFIIIDTGAGISGSTMDFAQVADDILVVTTPEPTALVDAYAAIKVAHGRAPWSNVHLVINMARDEKEGERAVLRLKSMAAHYVGHRILDGGVILYDDAVGDAVRQRQPLLLAYPDSAAAAAVWKFAEKLLRQPPPTQRHAPGEPEPAPGVLDRLLSMFQRPSA